MPRALDEQMQNSNRFTSAVLPQSNRRIAHL
jgi:hypothetical protein